MEDVPTARGERRHSREQAARGRPPLPDERLHLQAAAAGTALVTSDLVVRWGVEDMRDHSPDVAVFVGLSRAPDSVDGSLDLSAYGGRCELIVELVSLSTRDNDVVKKASTTTRSASLSTSSSTRTRRAAPRWVRAYQRTPAGYAYVQPDRGGRVALPVLGLSLGLRDGHAVCFDAETGEEFEDYSRLREDRQRERDQAATRRKSRPGHHRAGRCPQNRRARRSRRQEGSRPAAPAGPAATKEADDQREQAERREGGRQAAPGEGSRRRRERPQRSVHPRPAREIAHCSRPAAPTRPPPPAEADERRDSEVRIPPAQ